MAKVIILTDSTAYIPQAMADQLPISVIPLTLILEGKTYSDGVDIMPDDFYQRLLIKQ